MAKLLEKSGSELLASLVNIAAPIGNLIQDDVLCKAIVDCIEKLDKETAAIKRNNIAVMMTLYADIVPLLLNEKHTQDIMLILSEVEGCTVKEMLAKNGADLVADAIAAWKEQIGPFARRAGLMEPKKSS